LYLTGNSLGQPPSGIRGTGPLVGPPEPNRFLGGCGVGDAEALLVGDALLLRALLLRSVLACVLTGRSFAMSFMSIAKPPLTIFLGFQAAFFIVG
jgi:hypothetical protein